MWLWIKLYPVVWNSAHLQSLFPVFPSPSWSMWLTGRKAPTNEQTLMQNKTLKLGNMYITKGSLLHSDHTLLNWNSNIKMHQRKSVTILWRRKKSKRKKKTFMEPPPVIKEDCFWQWHHLVPLQLHGSSWQQCNLVLWLIKSWCLNFQLWTTMHN